VSPPPANAAGRRVKGLLAGSSWCGGHARRPIGAAPGAACKLPVARVVGTSDDSPPWPFPCSPLLPARRRRCVANLDDVLAESVGAEEGPLTCRELSATPARRRFAPPRATARRRSASASPRRGGRGRPSGIRADRRAAGCGLPISGVGGLLAEPTQRLRVSLVPA